MADEDKIEPTKDGFRIRVRYGKGLRARLVIRTLDPVIAAVRARRLREIAEMLTRAERSGQALLVLTEAAGAESDRDFAGYVQVALDLCKDAPRTRRAKVRSSITLQELGEQWTTGRLHRDFPDHIKLKKTAEHDAGRLEAYVYPVIGSKPVASLTLEDAEEVMRRLPEGLDPTTRRHNGHLLVRLLNLSVWPLRIRDASPIPRGFLPNRGPKKALGYLYPDEERRLLGHVDVPFCYRLLWGFLCREGMREGEAFSLTWGDIDLQRGAVRLDKNKTDDPRAWALDPAVARALTAYKALLRADAERSDLVFTDPMGRAHSPFGAAALLRSHLEAVGLKDERPELFESTAQRKQMRVHDLRGTFVTIGLANDKTEAWISARTGHGSSTMINNYRRVASLFKELDMGTLAPLDAALPELRGAILSGAGGVAQRWATNSENSEKTQRPQGDSKPCPVDGAQHDSVISAAADSPAGTAEHGGPPDPSRVGHSLAQVDPVETALGEALLRASRDGAWDAAQAIVDELRARRTARAGVLDLEAERARRKGAKP